MLSRLPLFLMLAWSLLCQAEPLQLGRPVPRLSFHASNENTILIDGPSDKVYIINFWATWCAPCKEEMPLLDAYYKAHRAEGLEVIAVSIDEPRKQNEARSYAAHFSFPTVLKGNADVGGLGKLWRIPSTFIVDKHGLLRKDGHVGDAAITKDELERIVTPLLRPQ